MRKRLLIEVDWEDATSKASWEEECDTDFKIAHCHSVGWRLKADKRYVLIARQRDDMGDFADRLKIPKGCIKSIRRLE